MPSHRGWLSICVVCCDWQSCLPAGGADDLLPAIQLTAQDEQLTLILPGNWLDEHPLGREMVDQECQWQSYVHWILRVASGDTLK